MSQWKNDDSAANSVIWGTAQLDQTVNSANRDLLFGNTTADAYYTGATHGQYGVDVTEQQAARGSGADRGAHAGWNLKTEGSGGRAGRVHIETLVAMRSMTGDAEDITFPDLGIQILTQPVSGSGSSTGDEQVTFTVVADSAPPGTGLTYLWRFANNDAVVDDLTHSDPTLASLTVDANTANNGEGYYVEISAAGATNVVSDSVTITVTA